MYTIISLYAQLMISYPMLKGDILDMLITVNEAYNSHEITLCELYTDAMLYADYIKDIAA